MAECNFVIAWEPNALCHSSLLCGIFRFLPGSARLSHLNKAERRFPSRCHCIAAAHVRFRCFVLRCITIQFMMTKNSWTNCPSKLLMSEAGWNSINAKPFHFYRVIRLSLLLMLWDAHNRNGINFGGRLRTLCAMQNVGAHFICMYVVVACRHYIYTMASRSHNNDWWLVS